MDIASYQVREGDLISVSDRDGSSALSTGYLTENPRFSGGELFSVDRDVLSVKVLRQPVADEINNPANEKLIVEFYSK